MRDDFVTELDMYDLILEIKLLTENQQAQGGLKVILVSICVFCPVDEFGSCYIQKESNSIHTLSL